MNPLDVLNDAPLAGLMLVVALGFLLGKLSWRGFGLGPAGGTLLVALLFGSAGFRFHPPGARPDVTIGTFGFALFIYSVGFEAGPRFFSGLTGGQGWRFVLVGVLVNVFALAIAVLGGRLLGLGDSVTAGLLAGALTSTPTYATAIEACRDPALLAMTFAVAYPLGVAGLQLLIEFLPRAMGDDLAAGSAAEDDEADRPSSPLFVRAFELREPELAGRTLAELDLRGRTGCWVTRLHRGQEVCVPGGATRVEVGDHLMARGEVDALHAFEKLVGPEVYDDELRRRLPSPRAVHVSARAIVGLTLRDLDLIGRYRALVTRVVRSGVSLEAEADLVLMRDDIVHVAGRRDDVRAVARELGRFERSSHETDIAVYAAGVFLGLLLGRLHFDGFGFDFRLGTAGGLLLVGILLGRYRQIGPFSAHVPVAARQLVRDLGILLFVAETGVAAGASSLTGLPLLPVLGLGAAATFLPVLGALFVGRRLLRLRPVHAWGSVCGGMTSSAALLAVRRAADSNEPAISYAASYAVASVLVALAGQLVVFLMM